MWILNPKYIPKLQFNTISIVNTIFIIYIIHIVFNILYTCLNYHIITYAICMIKTTQIFLSNLT